MISKMPSQKSTDRRQDPRGGPLGNIQWTPCSDVLPKHGCHLVTRTGHANGFIGSRTAAVPGLPAHQRLEADQHGATRVLRSGGIHGDLIMPKGNQPPEDLFQWAEL